MHHIDLFLDDYRRVIERRRAFLEMGMGPKMVRLSVGVEHPQDLIADLEGALSAI